MRSVPLAWDMRNMRCIQGNTTAPASIINAPQNTPLPQTMFKTLVLAALLAFVAAGGSQVCLNKKEGCVEIQITKDCCAAVKQSGARP